MDNKTFIDEISIRCGLDKETVETLADTLCSVVADAAVEEDVVAIPGFGTFESKKKMERVVVHPSTGKKLLVPPKISLVFKPSALLKQKIRNK